MRFQMNIALFALKQVEMQMYFLFCINIKGIETVITLH